MSTVIDEPAVGSSTSSTQRLRTTMAAARVSVHWFGVRKSLTSQQTAQAADAFGAEDRFLSAAKKLLDTAHPAFKAVTAVRSQLQNYWKGISLPYPEYGIRLIRRHQMEEFADRMRQFQTELDDAVATLDSHYGELESVAQRKLGHLYNPRDYPESLIGLFQIGFDFPSVEPPNYLQHLNPELYQQECDRVQRRFDEAVQLAEEAFTGELAKLVSHLTDRLSGQADGKAKIFRDSAVENLTEFFNRFRHLNVRSNDQLDSLVEDAQRVIRCVRRSESAARIGLKMQRSGLMESIVIGLGVS